MKSALVLCALATSALSGTPVQVRVTPEALVKLQQQNPIARLQKPVEGEAKVSTPASQSILKQSRILHDGNHWTIVPLGAVVFLPEALKSKIDSAPTGSLVPFIEFLTLNRSWVSTHEVSFDQASGKEPLPAAKVAFWPKQDKMIIAVHQGGPISVCSDNQPLTLTTR